MTDNYNAQHDFAESLRVGYAAIREREAVKPESLRNYDFAKREYKPQTITDPPFGVPCE